MELVDIRRTRLKEWFGDKKLPPKDASFISQVIGGKFIGEKAARRLEKDHGIPEFYLDMPFDTEPPNTDAVYQDKARGALQTRLRYIQEILETLPDDDVKALLDEFQDKVDEKNKYYEQRVKEYIRKKSAKNV
ncbi:hypothetical protein [Citrobacter braakii]|uniref:hypothetical protein n=1 Tax=Citrobacter braakii TaxID=57706 RepID=UPI00403A7517